MAIATTGKGLKKKQGRKTMKFEVLEGTHQQVVYREVRHKDDRGSTQTICHKRYDLTWLKGEVIESDQQLDKLFRGKFKRVSDELTPHKGHVNFRYPQEGVDNPEPLETPELRDNPNLREYGDMESSYAGEEEDATELPEPIVKQPKKIQLPKVDLTGAKVVTKSFPYVMEEAEGYKVMKKDGGYFIVADETNLPIHADPMTKEDVVPFLEQYLIPQE